MTTHAHASRRVYGGATHPAPLAPLDGRKRPAKRGAPPLRKSPLDRLPPKKRALAHAAIQDFLAYYRATRKAAIVEEVAPVIAPIVLAEPEPHKKPRIYAEWGAAARKIKLWMDEHKRASAPEIAAALGMNPSNVRRELRNGIDGIEIAETVPHPTGGKPMIIWKIKSDAPIHTDPN